MSKVTTVIFDMYETLMQNELGHWHTSFDTIIKEQNLDVSRELLWKVWFPLDQAFRTSRYTPGSPFKSYFEAWRDSFIQAFSALGVEGDAAAAARRFSLDLSRRPLYSETVRSLSDIGKEWRIGLLSNADVDYLYPALKCFPVKFAAVITSEEARCYKPEPGLFHQMLGRLGITAEEAVYVGDRQFEDVKGASGVGMRSVWINRAGLPLDPELPKPDYQVTSLMQIPEVLRMAEGVSMQIGNAAVRKDSPGNRRFLAGGLWVSPGTSSTLLPGREKRSGDERIQ